MADQKKVSRNPFSKDAQNRPIWFMSAGAVTALALVFGVGDFDTASSTRKQVKAAKSQTEVAILAPMCAATIIADPALLEEFTKADKWRRDDVMVAAFKGRGKTLGDEVADRCVEVVDETIAANKAKADKEKKT